MRIINEVASRNRSASVRMKNRHDHDASSITADRRAANGVARANRGLHV